MPRIYYQRRAEYVTSLIIAETKYNCAASKCSMTVVTPHTLNHYARYLNMFGLSLSRSRYSREIRSSMRFLMTLKSGCAESKKWLSFGVDAKGKN